LRKINALRVADKRRNSSKSKKELPRRSKYASSLWMSFSDHIEETQETGENGVK